MDRSVYISVVFLVILSVPFSLAFRLGAPVESCYGHEIIHRSRFTNQLLSKRVCTSNCQHFIYQKAVDGSALQQRNEVLPVTNGPCADTNYYTCGCTYHFTMNITVNRGYIIQARPETPEFIRGATLYGTWIIHPSDSSITKVLHCAREAAMENGIKYNNTVTHANANSLPTLDFYYQAPTPEEIITVYEGQCPSNLTFFFTVADNVELFYFPRQSEPREFRCPQVCDSPTTDSTTDADSTTDTRDRPTTTTTERVELSQRTVVPSTTMVSLTPTLALTVVGVVCSIVFFIVGVVGGFAGGALVVYYYCVKRQQRNYELTPAPLYEDVTTITVVQDKDELELKDNVAYGHLK